MLSLLIQKFFFDFILFNKILFLKNYLNKTINQLKTLTT